MVAEGFRQNQTVAVLFSGGLDSAVMLADAAGQHRTCPIYISAGFGWESPERRAAERLLRAQPYLDRVQPMVTLTADMRDVYPSDHWAVRGEAPAFDTPDQDVYIEGRNIFLLAKAAIFMARAGIGRVLMGPLAGNAFPDATSEFFAAMQRALSLGLAAPLAIETPLARLHKADVIRRGVALGVPFELTLSCMQPVEGQHCGRCSKCRERRDGFTAAGVPDPTGYATRPVR